MNSSTKLDDQEIENQKEVENQTIRNRADEQSSRQNMTFEEQQQFARKVAQEGLYDYCTQGHDWFLAPQISMKQQSPIDIRGNVEFEPKMQLKVHYQTGPGQLVKGRYTLNLPAGHMGGMVFYDMNGEGPIHYELDHMHFHGKAEHLVEGQQYDLEMHFVHIQVDPVTKEFINPDFSQVTPYHQSRAVVGFLFKESSESHPFIQKLNPHDLSQISSINFADIFQDNKEPGFYHYQGSLTFPPCFEVVNWILHKEVLPISKEHLQAIQAYCVDGQGNFNVRAPMPLHGRRIIKNFQ